MDLRKFFDTITISVPNEKDGDTLSEILAQEELQDDIKRINRDTFVFYYPKDCERCEAYEDVQNIFNKLESKYIFNYEII